MGVDKIKIMLKQNNIEDVFQLAEAKLEFMGTKWYLIFVSVG